MSRGRERREAYARGPVHTGLLAAIAIDCKRLLFKLDRVILNGLVWDVQRKVRQLAEFSWKYAPGKSCPYCGARRSTAVMQVGTQDLRECAGCSLVFTYPRLKERFLERYYSSRFVVGGHDPDEVEKLDFDNLERYPKFDRRRELDLLAEHKRGGRLLDIGCSWGFLMLQAMKRGFTVRGVEPGERYAAFGRERLGLDIFIGPLEEAGLAEGSFDAVTAIHVLEHLPDLGKGLREIHRVLKEDGAALLIVPNFESLTREMYGIYWEWLSPRDHYYHFTRAFLEKALAEAGFEATIRSEEGQFSARLLGSIYSESEIRDLYRDFRGSELVAVARKAARREGGSR